MHAFLKSANLIAGRSFLQASSMKCQDEAGVEIKPMGFIIGLNDALVLPAHLHFSGLYGQVL